MSSESGTQSVGEVTRSQAGDSPAKDTMSNSTDSNMKLFTREELKSRNNRTDAVIIIHNGVYDVTKFLLDHPGGEEVLLEKAGQDATDPFEDVSHSSDARSLMNKYKIGELVEADRTQSKAAFAASWNNDQPLENNSLKSWLAPLLLGIAATIIYRYLFA